MSKANKPENLYSVKIRIKSNDPNVTFYNSIRSGVVISSSKKVAESTTLKAFNEDPNLIRKNGYAVIIKSALIRQDFCFTSEIKAV